MVKFGENSANFGQIWANLRNFGEKTAKNSAIFNGNFEIRERCKGVHCVDLGESFPTSIYLQKSASIQPRAPRSLGENIQYYSIVSLAAGGLPFGGAPELQPTLTPRGSRAAGGGALERQARVAAKEANELLVLENE